MLLQSAGWLQGSGTGTAAVQRHEEKVADYEGIFGAIQLSICDSGICSCRE